MVMLKVRIKVDQGASTFGMRGPLGVKEPNMHNPNQFMASQNLLYNFFK